MKVLHCVSYTLFTGSSSRFPVTFETLIIIEWHTCSPDLILEGTANMLLKCTPISRKGPSYDARYPCKAPPRVLCMLIKFSITINRFQISLLLCLCWFAFFIFTKSNDENKLMRIQMILIQIRTALWHIYSQNLTSLNLGYPFLFLRTGHTWPGDKNGVFLHFIRGWQVEHQM